jgi:hypothetical protein
MQILEVGKKYLAQKETVKIEHYSKKKTIRGRYKLPYKKDLKEDRTGSKFIYRQC